MEDTGRPAEVETGAGVSVGAGGASQEVGSGAGAVWGKGVPLTIPPLQTSIDLMLRRVR